jgi:hypothetical protein
VKFTLSWLKDHLDTDADVGAVADAMTMAGLEVEEVHDPIASLAPFTVAKIVSAERHPNATLVDWSPALSLEGDDALTNPEYFVDGIHFSPEGSLWFAEGHGEYIVGRAR